MDLLLIGGGGHGRVCLDIARACGFTDIGIVDPMLGEGSRLNGAKVVNEPVIGTYCGLTVFIAIGSQSRRRELLLSIERSGAELTTLVHPSAVVSPFAEIGAGSVVMPLAVIQTGAHLGRACIVNTHAHLDHDNLLQDGVQICPGVASAGNVRIGAWSFVGTGANLCPGVAIGSGASVGAGSTVLHDVADGVRVVGTPARARAGSASSH